jgi:tripeptide aminopeptidase
MDAMKPLNLPSDPLFQAAVARYAQESRRIVDLCIQIQQVEAPTGHEEKRAEWVATYFRRLGLAGIVQDEVHNVYACVPGLRPSPAVLVSAHTDTVFPADTDLTIRIDPDSGHIFGPGIGDNSTGVAGLLILAETLLDLDRPPVDIWLVANSCEEGLGDLQGMRAVMDRLGDRLGAAIVVEGMGVGRIVHRGLGVRRYRISAAAPGGHSWSDFGSASAIHSLVQMATELVQLQVPSQPRTTFNIGRIWGGTSINTIAQTAAMDLDLRSEGAEALSALVGQVEEIVARHQSAHRAHQNGVQIELSQIGNRPPGQIGPDHPLVQAAIQLAVDDGGDERAELRISSTDANIPLSRGLPAICIGLTDGGNAHRLEEWIDPVPLTSGLRQLLALTWWTATWLGSDQG